MLNFSELQPWTKTSSRIASLSKNRVWDLSSCSISTSIFLMFEHESTCSVRHTHITHIATVCVCVSACCYLPQGQTSRHGKSTLSELQAQVIYSNVPWNELASLNTNTHTHNSLLWAEEPQQGLLRTELSQRCTCSNPVEECVCVSSPHSPVRWSADKLHNHQQNNKPLRTKQTFYSFPQSACEKEARNISRSFGGNLFKQNHKFWISAHLKE